MLKKQNKNSFLKNWMFFSLFFICFFFLLPNLEGAYLKNIPITIVQPNGETLRVFASGDEFYNWIHDKNGYTIIRDQKTGYYVYALEDDGDLYPSSYIVHSDDVLNSLNLTTLNIPKHLKHSLKYRKIPEELFPQGLPGGAENFFPAPKSGTINNIVIFIRFSGESEFTDLNSTYESMFNSSTSGYNSMYNYFYEASYNALSVSTTFYPTPPATTVISYQDSQLRAYYQPYNESTNPSGYDPNDSSDSRVREHTLLKNAVDSVSLQVPGTLNIDGDGDGRVDNVCFIVSGAPDGWSDLLWPHQWSLYTAGKEAYINSKRVYTYNFQLQTSLASAGVGVLCHEMFHSIGAPDLYHYYTNTDLHPVSSWGLMEYNSNPPRHMGSYMKYRYGSWISSIPEITTNGTYTLNPLTSTTGNCYKIASPHSITEYFLVEYRKKSGTFEDSLPAQGLLVYRIDSSLDGKGNRDGLPDEVYIYRPDGTLSANGTPASANFSSDAGRTAMNDSTNPSSFLANGALGGLNISNVGSINSTISFDVSFTTPRITLSVSTLHFGATTSGDKTSNQQIQISNSGAGTLNWSITDDLDWLSCSPTSGVDAGVITVSVDDPTGKTAGTYTGTITAADSSASNSPQTVSVNLKVYETGSDSAPIGYFDTPTNNSTVSGSVAVTGWALDDIDIKHIEIKRNSDPDDDPAAIGGDGLVHIGYALRVKGSRTDIEALYTDYPQNDRAGWGYMMLTFGLPRRGNGTFTLYAIAEDEGGKRTLLGTKDIVADNTNRIKPFGAIDTPGAGQVISGAAYVNFGWALTPSPKWIPYDGSTLYWSIDSVIKGNVDYGDNRTDIAGAFPECLNANTAGGHKYIDTTQYTNGVHTIGWLAYDSDGVGDGMGSRFFEIQNVGGASVKLAALEGMKYEEDMSGRLKISIEGSREIEIEELGYLKLQLVAEGGARFIGWGADKTKNLPIGSTLDEDNGIFYWMPGPGFLNQHILHFAVTDGVSVSQPVEVIVNIVPKRYEIHREREDRKIKRFSFINSVIQFLLLARMYI